MFIFRLFEGGIVLKMIDRHTDAFYLRRYRAPPPANLVIAQNRKKVFKNIFFKKGCPGDRAHRGRTGHTIHFAVPSHWGTHGIKKDFF